LSIRLSTPETYSIPTAAILQDQANLTQLNVQMATGLAVNSPASNPVAESQSIAINQQLAAYAVDGQTSSIAQSNLQNLSSTVGSISTLLQSLRQTALAAANATVNAQDRQAMGYTVANNLQNLLQIGNTKTPDGNYLLAGSQTNTQPFSQATSGVIYNGDASTNNLQIAPGITVPSSLSGQFLLMNIPTGNGYAQVSAASGNVNLTGSVTVSVEGVTNTTQASQMQSQNQSFALTFVTGTSVSGNNVYYSITPSGSTTAVSGLYTAGTTVVVSGSQYLIQGTPAVSGSTSSGDVFYLKPSSNQSLFQTVQDLATYLNGAGTGASSQAAFSQHISNIISNLNQGLTRTLTAQAYVGSALAQVTAVGQTSSTAQTNDQVAVNNLMSANLPAVATQFAQGTSAMQAALSAFAAMQGLNLFSTLKF
jgi:flagellar hook-associated protein 3 FlgL